MPPGIEIVRIDAPGDDARVCHYDQLAEGVKGRLPELVPADDARRIVETDEPEAFDALDVVKFTGYLRIETAPDRSASD